MSMFGVSDTSKLESAKPGTLGPITLNGGSYWIETIATGTGTINLQRQGPDDKTWTARIREIATPKAEQTVILPPGTYRWVIQGFTAVYLEITRMLPA